MVGGCFYTFRILLLIFLLSSFLLVLFWFDFSFVQQIFSCFSLSHFFFPSRFFQLFFHRILIFKNFSSFFLWPPFFGLFPPTFQQTFTFFSIFLYFLINIQIIISFLHAFIHVSISWSHLRLQIFAVFEKKVFKDNIKILVTCKFPLFVIAFYSRIILFDLSWEVYLNCKDEHDDCQDRCQKWWWPKNILGGTPQSHFWVINVIIALFILYLSWLMRL